VKEPSSKKNAVEAPARPATKRFGVDLPADPEALPVMRAFAEAIALEAGFSERARNHIQLALEEVAVNILIHGSGPGSEIKLLVTLEADHAVWEILDRGKPFPFEESVSRYDGMPTMDQPVGGVGLFLVRKVMDEVRYEPATAQGNRMILTKYKERA
jgi:serine/threonine-protein kinase RsbW